MLFYIYACENCYKGLHGIETTYVGDFNNERDANDYALELALELIDSYECLSSEYDDYENEDERYAAMVEDCIYTVHPIRDKYQNVDSSFLDRIAYTLGDEEFVRHYCGGADVK